MIITGRIFEIVIINDAVAQIVIKKKVNDKVVPVAISVIGFWKDKALRELKVKDKIKGNLYLKSKLYNGKYYTDVFMKEIIRIEEHITNKINSPNLFKEQGGMVDTETGEFFSD